tara:strand:- start:2622 stop:2762 length:141 start_codon:yes stop_codon:yes gene_type:complete
MFHKATSVLEANENVEGDFWPSAEFLRSFSSMFLKQNLDKWFNSSW